MGKFWRFLTYFFTALMSVMLTLAVLIYSGALNPAQPAGGSSKLDVLQALIDERFIGEVDDTAITDEAAAAMVNALGDRWSYYVPASQYAMFQSNQENAYVGVGMTVTAREDQKGIDIQQVTPGGPAEAAGVRAGDVLTAVDDTDITSLDLTTVQGMVRGEEGTQVKLTLLRDGEQVSYTITRQQFQTAVATGEMLPGKIGLVTIENFNTRCADETIAAVEELLDQGAESLIFDVRNNGGGYKNEMVKVLDYLLPEGPLFRSVDYTGHEETDYSDADCLEIPMAVLVNEDSYSAAEFFAAALREYDVATVVGGQTCGKGYFQVTYSLGDGSMVGLSIGKYFTPEGVSLAGVGITPDKLVEVDEETYVAIYYDQLEPGEDPQIQAAVELLEGE